CACAPRRPNAPRPWPGRPRCCAVSAPSGRGDRPRPPPGPRRRWRWSRPRGPSGPRGPHARIRPPIPTAARTRSWPAPSTPPRPPASAHAAQPPQVREQGPDPHPGGALGPEGRLALAERGAGDVEVDPGNAAGELAHEQAADDGPRPALARHVVQVGDVALE